MTTKVKKSRSEDHLLYYDKKFFQHRATFRTDYKLLAKWIRRNVDAESFGDIGCGNAFIVSDLLNFGKQAWGVDGADNFEKFADMQARKYLQRINLAEPQKLNKSEVAICLEVGERIDKENADVLVKNISSTCAHTIIFTAGQPGEAGIHHINLRPNSYWLRKFAKFNYCLDVAMTEKFKSDLSGKLMGLTWYLDDILIMRKCESHNTERVLMATGKYVNQLKSQIHHLETINSKLKKEAWDNAQQLHSVVNSRRWKASSGIIRVIKK